jgi:hypothetical protein
MLTDDQIAQLDDPTIRQHLVAQFMTPNGDTRKTGWRVYSESGVKYRIRAEYGFDVIGDQEPYFSLTGEIERRSGNHRWCFDSGGQIHEEVSKHFPELEPLRRWHLVFATEGPMHYVANARYWLDLHYGRSQWERRPNGDPLACFKSVVVFGAVEGDKVPGEEVEISEWCDNRFPALMHQFYRDLATFREEHKAKFFPVPAGV